MIIEIKTPEFSESVQSGTLLAWRVEPGAHVERDAVLADLETDKVILEVTAPAAGTLTEIRVPADSEVSGEQVLAVLDTEAASGAALPVAVAPAAARQVSLTAPAPAQPIHRPPSQRRHPAASPVWSAEPVAARAPVVLGKPDDPRVRRVPMTRLRQRIAERLVEAQHTAAILTTFNDVNMQPVQALRKRYQERFMQEHGVKLGLMSFFVKAACQALKQFPVLNASVDGRDILYHDYFDIGIAVSSDRGLVVPVLRGADELTFAQIEQAIADFGKRANALALTLEELEGGTFTISNGGVFGSLLSTPILNAPQSAVMGLHRIEERPVAEQGEVLIRPMMYLALSYDHRIIDGREAVGFLKTVKTLLEDPASLLLEV